MSVRTDRPNVLLEGGTPSQPHMDTLATINAAQDADGAHNEAGDFNTANADHPLTRTVSVSLRASMNDLCLRKARSTWAPTSEALQSIFRQKRFTTLAGASEVSGDLKSVVLHAISMDNVNSTFPIAVGTQVTSVDNSTFSITGASFAAIVSPQAASNTAVTLQKDDVSLGARAPYSSHTLSCGARVSSTNLPCTLQRPPVACCLLSFAPLPVHWQACLLSLARVHLPVASILLLSPCSSLPIPSSSLFLPLRSCRAPPAHPWGCTRRHV